ncbi:hypothetical protein [Shinella zoogloeoides]
MSFIETAKDIYSMASGASDYVAISARRFCVSPSQESAEYFRAFGDMASGAGTVIHGVSHVIDGVANLYGSAAGSDPPHWATGSASRMNLFGKYMV